MARSWMHSARVLVVVASLVAAGCEASPPAGLPAADEPIADAGRDAAAASVTTCCRLDNDRGERLDYKCSTALDRGYLEARGYRCGLAQ